MAKRLLALLVVLPLVFSSQLAWGAKKKAPKPFKSDEVTLAVAHPVVYGNTGSVNSITAKEFENSCSIPSSNGLDAYVFEVPKEYQAIDTEVSAIGSSSGPAGWDLDIYLYDKDCKTTFAINAEGTDETGVMPKGTSWILIHNYLGDPGISAHIELKPYKI